MEPLETEIRQFIIDNFLFGTDDGTLSGDTSLLGNGVIDSTGVVELVAFADRTYGVKIDDVEIVPENFDTIERLARFIAGKRA
jgi:acyl carrier protein